MGTDTANKVGVVVSWVAIIVPILLFGVSLIAPTWSSSALIGVGSFLDMGLATLVLPILIVMGSIVLMGVAIGINMSNHNNKIYTRILVLEIISIFAFAIWYAVSIAHATPLR